MASFLIRFICFGILQPLLRHVCPAALLDEFCVESFCLLTIFLSFISTNAYWPFHAIVDVIVGPETPEDIPFKEPEQPQTLELKEPPVGSVGRSGLTEQPTELLQEPSNILNLASSSTVLKGEPSVEENQSLAHLLNQLFNGLDALKGLNLDGFRQIYPIFLVIFGAVVFGILLSSIITVVNTLNNLPLVGGMLQGVFELIGLIVLVRFVSVNLLLQHRRAELFARIALLKKELLGPPKA